MADCANSSKGAPVDALGRGVDERGDVFSAWLEHGDTDGGFETDLVLKCDAAPRDGEVAEGGVGGEAAVAGATNAEEQDGDAEEKAREASSIYDLLED